MVNINELKFQKLDLQGLKVLVEWAEEEGWNPGPYDADVYWQTDPDGFYGYYMDDNLIAGGAIVSYSGEFGFMGLFIVKPEFRDKGIGRQLWYQRRNMLLSRLNSGASIGMDGVVDMQPFYEEGGFKIAFRDERYERPGTNFTIDSHITPLNEEDLYSIMEYDRECFGVPREQFLKPWLKMPGNIAFKYKRDNKLRGFAIVRKASKGYKACPLYADNESIAEELYKACLNSVVGDPLYLDIPVVNQNAVDLIKEYKATYVFECARMYYGKPPEININKIFGITTFELG